MEDTTQLPCGHTVDTWFDRTVCACGQMHTRCQQCGHPADCPLEVILTVAELATFLHIARMSLYRLIWRGTVDVIKTPALRVTGTAAKKAFPDLADVDLAAMQRAYYTGKICQASHFHRDEKVPAVTAIDLKDRRLPACQACADRLATTWEAGA